MRNLFQARRVVRSWSIRCGIVALGLSISLTVSSYAQQPDPTSRHGQSPAAIKYMGAGSCNASGCHGLPEGRDRRYQNILQNEYWIWEWNAAKYQNRVDVGHSKAFTNLKTADSLRMATNLGIKSPESAPKCLACHAVPVEKNRQGPAYDVKEGVTCEGCHGPAERWLGPHTSKDWAKMDKAKRAELGMYDTKNLIARAELCLRCHQGSEKAIVDHELIGAGHPRLGFDLDSFSEFMPIHWIVPNEGKAWNGVRVWAVGQAKALQQQVELLVLSRKSQALPWPDFAQLDCYACHHDIADRVRGIAETEKKLQRWRVKEYPGGKPGRLIWNGANYMVLRHAVREVLPEKAVVLDESFSKLHEWFLGKSSSGELEPVFTKLQQVCSEVASLMAERTFTQKEVWGILRRIAGDFNAIGDAGFQSAEQAVLAVSSLRTSYVQTVGAMPNDKAFLAAFGRLNNDVEFGYKFNPIQFSQHLSEVRKLLEVEVSSANGAGVIPSKPAP